MENSTSDIQVLMKLVKRVDDRQQLAELVSRYGMAVDDRDFETVAAMFAPDGEFNGIKGRQAVIDHYRERTALFTTSSHFAHTWHFDFDDEACPRGTISAHAELCIGGKAIEVSLRYLDRYVRGDQGWMFKSRNLRFRYVLPLDEVADSLDDPLRVRWPGTPPVAADLPDPLPTYIASRRAEARKN